MRRPLMLVGVALVVGLLVLALFAPLIAPYDYEKQDLCRGLEGPGAEHWLGMDKHGRDILSRLVYGARVSVLVGVFTVLISSAGGMLVGSVAGFRGGVTDQVIMRVIDILMAFPGILLAIALTAVLGPSLRNVIIALSVLGWVAYARLVRGQILVEREKDYVAAAKALGASETRIIVRHLIVNVSTPVIIQATFGMAGAILAEASLSFLGLGAQDMPSWGAMLNEGASFLRTAPHIALFPGLAIMLTVLGFNFLGDGFRDALSPKTGKR